MSGRLSPNFTVLVTRPRAQSAGLAQLITDAGGQAVLAPMIEIEATGAQLDPELRQALEDPQATAVFLSPNSVHFGLDTQQPLKISSRIVAMGAATAAALQAAGYTVDATPVGGIDSEAVLAHPLMATPQGRTFIVFQGEDGRGVVQESLREAGAHLLTHVCYRRIAPKLSSADFSALWQAHQPDVCVITSATALQNLLQLTAGHCPEVLDTEFVVLSQRLKRLVREQGVRGRVRVARAASDEGLFAALFDASD